jgi:hypothetical protein
VKSADVGNPTLVLTALLKHMKARREAINTAFPKHLKKKAYAKLVGEHSELERLETVMEDAFTRANAADQSTEGDDDDE